MNWNQAGWVGLVALLLVAFGYYLGSVERQRAFMERQPSFMERQPPFMEQAQHGVDAGASVDQEIRGEVHQYVFERCVEAGASALGWGHETNIGWTQVKARVRSAFRTYINEFADAAIDAVEAGMSFRERLEIYNAIGRSCEDAISAGRR